MPGVGLDLIEIERVARALERRPRLADRLFTEAERAFAAQRSEPARHLAVRFCAKEAVAKALALRDGDWQDVEVVGGGDVSHTRRWGRWPVPVGLASVAVVAAIVGFALATPGGEVRVTDDTGSLSVRVSKASASACTRSPRGHIGTIHTSWPSRSRAATSGSTNASSGPCGRLEVT